MLNRASLIKHLEERLYVNDHFFAFTSAQMRAFGVDSELADMVWTLSHKKDQLIIQIAGVKAMTQAEFRRFANGELTPGDSTKIRRKVYCSAVKEWSRMKAKVREFGLTRQLRNQLSIVSRGLCGKKFDGYQYSAAFLDVKDAIGELFWHWSASHNPRELVERYRKVFEAHELSNGGTE